MGLGTPTTAFEASETFSSISMTCPQCPLSSFEDPLKRGLIQFDTNSSLPSTGSGHPSKIASRVGAQGLPSSISALRKAWRSLHFKLDSWAYCNCDKVADEFQAGTGRERKPGAPEKLGWGHPVCQGLYYASRTAAH